MSHVNRVGIARISGYSPSKLKLTTEQREQLQEQTGVYDEELDEYLCGSERVPGPIQDALEQITGIRDVCDQHGYIKLLPDASISRPEKPRRRPLGRPLQRVHAGGLIGMSLDRYDGSGNW